MFKPARCITLAGLLALSLSLSACWEAKTPLFESSQSASPLPSGKYLYNQSEEPEPALVQLMKIPGGGYVYINEEEGNALPLLAYEFDDGWYLLQLGPVEDMLLAIARTTHERTEIFDPECDEQMGELPGVIRTSRRYAGFNCRFETLEAALAAARIFQQRIEAGEISEPTGWFIPTPVENSEEATL